ncbi:hypothetical protein CJU89_0431 [Yarrowia sp. B02]|nr:hypothetical protein CJU89_0431 [Yarrowia sp. B02]
MEYRHLDLASRLFSSCIFDEALTVLETGLLRTPIELPKSRETAVLMTLAAYPLSHLGAKTVNTMAYNSVHRGMRDSQKTPGARAIALLRRLFEFSKGTGEAPARMKLVLRESLTKYLTSEQAADVVKHMTKTYDTSYTKERKSRVKVLTRAEWDGACTVPLDRSKAEGLDSSLLRDVIPHHEQRKDRSDHLEPLLTYANVSATWMTLWALYGYYLSCSGSASAAHLSAWATVRPLLVVIQDIVEADPEILQTFYKPRNGSKISDLCARFLPPRGTTFEPFFNADEDFGSNFDTETLEHLREVAFLESMEIRERWVEIVRKNLDLLTRAPRAAEKELLKCFTDFAARHPQVIPHVYPCEHLPEYYTVFMLQKYIKRSTQEYRREISGYSQFIGHDAFMDEIRSGREKEKEMFEDAIQTKYLEVALEAVPGGNIIEEDLDNISTRLYCFYGHAPLWLRLALDTEGFSYEDCQQSLKIGKKTRLDALTSYDLDDEANVHELCKQEEDVLAAMVEAKLVLGEYM